jgi:hypothetical protein
MIRLQKFKFEKLLVTLVTKDTKAVTKLLTNYRFCGDGLYMHSEIVGKYAKVDVLDVNGKPVKSI